MPIRPLRLALLLAAISPALQAETAIDAVSAKRIDAVFAAFDVPGSPGCALAVYERGRPIYVKGYGLASAEHGVAIDPQRTVFDLGSTSKQFTAASILLLEQDGKLALGDSVRKHVPELPAYFDEVTLDHLLRHTGGVRDYIALLMLGGARLEDHTTDADALAAIARQARLDFAPGSEHNYSNSGYFLLSQVVKQVSGKSLREFAQERIFTPLRMRHTEYLDDHTRVIPHRAASYDPGAEGRFRFSTSAWEQTGDGAVQSTVADLARWDANFYQPTVGGSDLVRKLQETGVLNDGEKLTYARGLIVTDYRGLRVVSHGGAWMGFRADLQRFPETGIGAAALCNLGSADPSGLLNQVADVMLADRLQAPPATTEPVVATKATSPGFKASDYVGTYYNPTQSLLRRIEVRDGTLRYVRPQGSDSELALDGEHRFRMLGVPGSAVLTFAPGQAGQRRLTLVTDGETIEMHEVAAFAPDAAALAAYAGEFESAELDTRWRALVEDGALKIRGRRGPLLPLTPAFRDAFIGAAGLLRYQRDAEGKVTGFAVDVGRARGIGFRKLGL